MDDPKVTCDDCGFEWFGDSAAHALRTIGSCTRCRGALTFHGAGDPPLPPMVDDLATDRVDLPAHLVLGNPRY